ncbi:DNA repair protein RecO [Streptomyces tendae]
MQQYLLLVGALRTLARGGRAPNLVLDAFLLRSLAVNGYAPTFGDCAKCGLPGPNRFFLVGSGGSVCVDCRVPGSVVPRRRPWNCSERCLRETGARRTRPSRGT